MKSQPRYCEAVDPGDEYVGGDKAGCDFRRGHSGGHSWELERQALECSTAEIERMRRQRAQRNGRKDGA